MYFPLDVNEQLANAMRAAAELRAEIGKVINEEESRSKARLILKDLYDTNDIIGDVVTRIGNFMGMLLADEVFVRSNDEIEINQKAINEKK